MTATYETRVESTSPLTEDERRMFDVVQVEAWREHQMRTLAEYRNTAEPGADYVSDFDQNVETDIDEYLQSNGLNASDPHYDEIRNLYLGAAINRIDEEQWYASAESRGQHGSTLASGRDEVLHTVRQRLGSEHSETRTDSDTATQESEYEAYAHEKTLEELHRTRENWASVSAKRQGRIYGGKNEHAEAEYQQSVRIAGISELRDQISENDDETTKNAKVISYLFAEQKHLRDLTTEKLQDTKLGKYVEWMNSGGRLKRLGKAALIGAGAAGLGFVGFLAAPVAGIGLGVAGGVAAAAGGTARFARTYARADRHRGMQTAESRFGQNGEKLDELYEIDSTADTDIKTRFSHVAGAYDDSFEEDTKNEQLKRRKAVGIGAAAIVVGTGAGYALAHSGDIIEGVQGGWVDFKDWINDDINHTPEGVNGHDLDNDGILDKNDHDIDGDGIKNRFDTSPKGVEVPEFDTDGDGVRNWQDVAPNNPEVGKLDWSDFNADAHLVHAGEGWYETFDELGMPVEIRDRVLTDIGPKLKEAGWAYYDNSANEWRISQPGTLPVEVLKIIAKGSEQQNFTLTA